MQLGFRQKEQFFHELVQLARSAVTLPNALEMLGRSARSRTAPCARAVRVRLQESDGIAAAFRNVGFSSADAAVIEAGENTGRLDVVFSELETYYHQLSEARRRVVAQSAYPVVVLHLGAILLAIPPAIVAGGWTTFFARSLPILFGFYLLLAVLWFGWQAIRRAVARSTASARFFTAIPLLGGFLRDWTAWRFARVLSLYVRAGGGLLNAFEIAGSSCENAVLRVTSASLVSAVKSGSGLTETIQTQKGWPDVLERAIEVGEHSGRLDEETLRASEIYKTRAMRKLDSLAHWAPKILYIGILLFMAWQIISMVTGVRATYRSMFDL